MGSRLLSAIIAVVWLAFAGATAPAGADHVAPLVRPGVGIQLLGSDGLCTLGFVFRQNERDETAATTRHWALTAGHCLPHFETHNEWPDGAGPSVVLLDGTMIGEVRIATVDPAKGFDFALVELELDPTEISPQVCYWGGPTGIHTTRHQDAEDMLIFGHGFDVEPRRVRGMLMTDHRVKHLGPSRQGDSGGPLLSLDGLAVGIQHLDGFDVGDIQDGKPWNGMALRLDHQLAWIADHTSLELELLTAPLRNVQWPQDLATAPAEPGCPGI